ncbi:hypothetical protein MHK_008493 [Candidatus Magnetomorum sp. HK-1]|nr:hypothetical protein MHK_008493 [Candidatus Magnetomorum sp. HK-1]
MKKDKKQWHRLLAMVLDPMFKKLGFDTNPEVDLSRKKQLIDLIVVEKADMILKQILQNYQKNSGLNLMILILII